MQLYQQTDIKRLLFGNEHCEALVDVHGNPNIVSDSHSGVTRPRPTRAWAWARVSADLLAVALWILQIAITSVTSHVMKSYLIRRQYWLGDFIFTRKKDREILTGTSYRLNLSYSRS